MGETPMWRRYLRLLGADVEADVSDEIEHHLEMRTRQLVERGMEPEAARREARRRFGDVERVRAELQREDREALRGRERRDRVGAVLQDVRYTARVLWRRPGFAAVALLTVAVGVGATSAIFSVLNAVLLEPLPYPAADRLVVPQTVNRETGDKWSVTYPDYELWREEGVFERVALAQQFGADVAGADPPERVSGARVTEEFFATLGVAPTLGRAPRPEEFTDGAPEVAAISEGLWQRRFGGAREAIGATIRVNGRPVEVVGVLPRELELLQTDLWMPLRITPEQRSEKEWDNHAYIAIARLAPGRSLESTRARLDELARRVEREHPQERSGRGITADPLHAWLVGEDLSRALWVFLGAVGFVLLIGCVNVANLLLSRAATRSREFAIRASIGAGRGRLIRQLLTESLVLALTGGALGVGLAYAGIRALVASAPADIPRLDAVEINAPVLLFALGISVLSAVGFGIAPALHGSARSPLQALGEGGLRTTGGGRGRRLRNLLVVGELALSMVLLVGAGLMLRSLDRLRNTDPGFRTEGLLTFSVRLSGERYEGDERKTPAFGELLQRIRQVPGVTSAGMVSSLPLGGGGLYLGRAFLPEGRPEPPAGEEVRGMWAVTDAGYFRTLGIPLLSGRGFDERDRETSVPVAIVSREFARQMFPDGRALGARVRSWRDENVYRQIVGVVDDVRVFGADDEIRPVMYVPHAQDDWGSMVVMVRGEGRPAALIPPVREVLQRFDPDLAMASVRTMDEVMARSVASRRFGAALLSSFAAVALLLAVIGIYGVLAYLVAQRTREIGVRMALGAGRGRVVRMVVREAAGVVLVGVGVGVAGAVALSRAMGPLLYEVSSTDPVTYLGVAVLLVVVALSASWLPARRASRVDPMVALRWE